MFKLFEQLLFHLQQEVVVILHFLRGVHHQSAHQVGAVRLVADPHGTRDGTKVHVVLITDREKAHWEITLWLLRSRVKKKKKVSVSTLVT